MSSNKLLGSFYVKALFAGVSADELAERPVEDLYGAAHSLWQIVAKRRPGRAQVCVLNPRTAGLLVLVGICGGIYLGYAFIGEKKQDSPPTDFRAVDVGASAMDLQIGDLFPLENCKTPEGVTTNFEDVLHGKKTLLIFASAGCPPCTEFFDYFETVKSEINEDVQVVVSLSDHNPEIKPPYDRLLKDFKVVFMNADYFAEKYNVMVYPTIVGIDRYGFMTHIQYVPSDRLEPDLRRTYTNL